MAKKMSRLVKIIMSLIIFFSALFQTGAPRKSVQMPELDTGEYGQWVDPFIGTGGIPWACAMLFPGPTAPFGLVRLSPDTSFAGGVNLFKISTSGYHAWQPQILGFSHTRLSGTGATDMGHFRVTPAIGDFDATKRLSKPQFFSHESEVASPGYYAVDLPGIDCMAELTATQHVGVHRYTFGAGKDARILIDATSFLTGGRAEDGQINIDPQAMEVTGEGRVFTTFTGRYGGLKGYFVAKFDRPFESYSTWSDGVSSPGATNARGNDAGADINFGNIKGGSVELKVGISFVSLENARENLEAETSGLNFDGVRQGAKEAWEDALSAVKITSNDSDIKTIFYTALYHSMIMPTNFTDVNGQYLGFGEKVGTAQGFTYRTDLSLWDTYRTLHPLLNLIAPQVQTDSLKSLLLMAEADGLFPRWPSGTGETNSMFGTPANMVIAESFLKGYRDFDVEAAYAYMKNAALQTLAPGAREQIDLKRYLDYGYVPADQTKDSVSKTLELAWADGSTALLAEALGKSEDAALFRERSLNYKNLWNTKSKYFQGKNADGSWERLLFPSYTSYYDDVLTTKIANSYCEGSARQWRWSAPQDIPGLIELFGRDYFIRELNAFMKDASPNRAALNPGGGYWQGNQHDIHAPYLFCDAGRPDLTQKWVRWILKNRHSTDLDGLDGNDDGGTLSAWYVFSAMGFYPIAGTDEYRIGSPNLEKAVIDLGGGKTLTIKAQNQSEENLYVQSVSLNGVKLSSPILKHSQIANGGEMVFDMGPKPATNGGF